MNDLPYWQRRSGRISNAAIPARQAATYGPDSMMMNKILILALATLLAGCVQTATESPAMDGHSAATGKVSCSASNRSQNEVGASATNAVRAQAGLPPVKVNMLLAKVAADHACDMARRGTMSHRGTNSAGPGPRVKAAGYAPSITAENIAAGPWDLGGVLAQWSATGGHRANMLRPTMRDFGIGYAYGADGRTRFWSAIYAAPKR